MPAEICPIPHNGRGPAPGESRAPSKVACSDAQSVPNPSLKSAGLVRHQMRRATRGQDPTGKTHPLYALVCDQCTQQS